MIDLHHRLAIQGAAGLVENATASATFSRVVHSLNAMGGDLWSKLSIDNPMNLLELGIHSSVVVHTLTLNCVSFYVHAQVYPVTFFLYSLRVFSVFSATVKL